MNELRTKAEMSFQKSKKMSVNSYDEYRDACTLINEWKEGMKTLNDAISANADSKSKVPLEHSVLLFRNAISVLEKKSKKFSDVEDAAKRFEQNQAKKAQDNKVALDAKRKEMWYRDSHPQTTPKIGNLKMPTTAPVAEQPVKRKAGRPKKEAVAA